MTSDRWQQISQLYHAALARHGDDRAAFLAEACRGDDPLRREIESLLAQPSAEQFLDRSAPVPHDFVTQDGTPTTQSANVPNDLDIGIASYVVIRPLGEGGMGVVYHARQSAPIRRDVALKVIKPGMDTRQVIARFESERQALALMDHPNIARVYEAGSTSAGRPYFAMEFLNGARITSYCDDKRLSVRERVEMFVPVCRAIQHAHQKGIIHRDIKPSNIIVVEQEGRPVPKVIDFGLAKALGHQLREASITFVGAVVGTLLYMSPEQADLGRDDLDTRTDVYSLGAVLYELLTGTTPLEWPDGGGYLEAIQKIRDVEPAAPSVRVRRSPDSETVASLRASDAGKLAKALDGELDWIVMKALDKDRARRYETVNGLARDLERYLGGDPVEAGPASGFYRLGKLARKHTTWLATATAFFALLVGWGATGTLMAVRARRAEQAAQAVNDFLRQDLLAQASVENQAAPGTQPDPDLKVRTALQRAADRVEGRFGSEPLVEASVRQTIGDAFRDLGLYPDARRQMERVVEVQRRELGETNPDTLRSMSRLGEMLYFEGKYDDGVALYTKMLATRPASKRDDADSLQWLSNLAVMLTAKGKYAEAEPVYVRALAGQRRVLGSDHRDTLDSIGNLAGLYRSMGKFAEAEPLYTEVLERRVRVFGREHPLTLTAMNNIGVFYHDLGRYKDAEPVWKNVLDVRRRLQGESHPDTLLLMTSLGTLYSEQGRFDLAEPLLVKALADDRRVLGDAHPQTASALGFLGLSYRTRGRFAQAEPLVAEALEGMRRARGDDRPATISLMNALGSVYLDEGKYREAQSLFKQAESTARRVLGDSHAITLTAGTGLGVVYRELQDEGSAEATLKNVLETRQQSLGTRHPATAEAMANLAELYVRQKQYAIAEQLQADAYNIYLAAFGDGHFSTIEAANNLAALYHAQQKDADAEALARKTLTAAASTPASWRSAVTRCALGASLAAQRKNEEAETLLLSAFPELSSRLDSISAPSRASVYRLADSIAQLYKETRRPLQAERWSNRALWK